LGRREAFIDRRDLNRVNSDLSDKAVAARDPAALRQSLLVLEIRIQRIQRHDARGPRRKQALRPRHLIRKRPASVGFLVGQRAEPLSRSLTMFRANALRGGATESSRSRISASAPIPDAFANFCSLSPGTNRRERNLMSDASSSVRYGGNTRFPRCAD